MRRARAPEQWRGIPLVAGVELVRSQTPVDVAGMLGERLGADVVVGLVPARAVLARVAAAAAAAAGPVSSWPSVASPPGAAREAVERASARRRQAEIQLRSLAPDADADAEPSQVRALGRALCGEDEPTAVDDIRAELAAVYATVAQRRRRSIEAAIVVATSAAALAGTGVVPPAVVVVALLAATLLAAAAAHRDRSRRAALHARMDAARRGLASPPLERERLRWNTLVGAGVDPAQAGAVAHALAQLRQARDDEKQAEAALRHATPGASPHIDLREHRAERPRRFGRGRQDGPGGLPLLHGMRGRPQLIVADDERFLGGEARRAFLREVIALGGAPSVVVVTADVDGWSLARIAVGANPPQAVIDLRSRPGEDETTP